MRRVVNSFKSTDTNKVYRDSKESISMIIPKETNKALVTNSTEIDF
jgi:hypothetical protein